MCKRKETYGSCIREVEAHNTHFKSPTRSRAACGLNASYDDRHTGPLVLQEKNPLTISKKNFGGFEYD